MKFLPICFAALSMLLVASCKEEKEKPKVIYENNQKPKTTPQAVDTAQIEIADLPIEFTGTNYLIHPIGDIRINDGSRARDNAAGNEISYTISNYNIFEITGFLRNLKFQQVGSDSLTVLTDKPVLIQTASYLKALSDRTRQQIIVYTLADMDTNKDGKLDQSDIKSLYISTAGGEKFTKLSTDFEELIDWRLLEDRSRIYFRTSEDTNKNGRFDRDDVVHYHFVDVSKGDWKVSAYNPL